jgi:CheY-like chemotaxis protein
LVVPAQLRCRDIRHLEASFLKKRGHNCSRGDLTLLAATLNKLVMAKAPVRRAGASAYPMRRRVQLSRFTVLVVDDEAPIRTNIAAILSPMGLRVLHAEEGFKALGLLEEAIDLAIVDTQMPGMHGFDLVRAIRIRQPRMHVLLLAPRGHAEPPWELPGWRPVPALAKPFTSAALLAKVSATLHGTMNGTPPRVPKGHHRRARG